MRARTRLVIVLAVLAVLVGALSATAGADVERYQVETRTYQIAVLNTYIHNYTVVVNPCDGSITIDGATQAGWYYTEETVTGTLVNEIISFTSVYDGPYNTGYTWYGSFDIDGGALSGMYSGTVTLTGTSVTDYRNHGQYVKEMGGGYDPAHSCIGMPLVSYGHTG
jgi:hypothetical protein